MIEKTLVAGTNSPVLPLRQTQQFFGVAAVQRKRLLNVDVGAREQRDPRERHMGVRGRHDVDDIGLNLIEELFRGRENFALSVSDYRGPDGSTAGSAIPTTRARSDP